MSPFTWRQITESCRVIATKIGHVMRVRLTAKLAEVVNGVDISCYREGDVVDLSERDCRMLIAERWAEAVPPLDVPPSRAWRPNARAVAGDRKRSRHRR